jgi:hypothetical protein
MVNREFGQDPPGSAAPLPLGNGLPVERASLLRLDEAFSLESFEGFLDRRVAAIEKLFRFTVGQRNVPVIPPVIATLQFQIESPLVWAGCPPGGGPHQPFLHLEERAFANAAASVVVFLGHDH